jgi:hypothetical protein
MRGTAVKSAGQPADVFQDATYWPGSLHKLLRTELERHRQRHGQTLEKFDPARSEGATQMRYEPYDMPALGGVKMLGVLAPRDDGFDGLQHSLDLFHSQDVRLIIQLGEALLSRGTARSTDVDHIRRMLGARKQAMLVCTDDLGRACELRRMGVRETGARAVQPNLIHLDPGFRTRLRTGDLFVVLGADCRAPANRDERPVRDRFGSDGRRGWPDRIGLVVSAVRPDLPQIVDGLHPKLIISAGDGLFVDETHGVDDPSAGQFGTRAIVFGDSDGRRIEHAIVGLTDGIVTLLPELIPGADDPAVDRPRMEDS